MIAIIWHTSILTQRHTVRWASQDERCKLGQLDLRLKRDQCTYVYICIDAPIHHTALYSTVLYYTSVIHWSCCTVLYFCKTLILQYRILSCRVLCIYYWCTWAVLSHLWCADRTELCCTVLFGLHSTSRDSTELSWIILQPTTVLCSTALCTYSDTMLWGIVLHCTVLHWAVLSTLCDDAWHDSTDDVTYDALMQYMALHCDMSHNVQWTVNSERSTVYSWPYWTESGG